MVIGTRKERQIQERERLILDVASRMLDERGYLAMNMDAIAAATEYSKGTIYNHFSSKEEVVMALATQTAATRVDLFRRAATFQGRSRERMTAIGVAIDLFADLYPQHFRAEHIVLAEGIRDKTSEKRQHELMACEQSCVETVAGIARDGVAAGELKLPEGMSVEGLVFGLWAVSYGGITIIATKPDLEQVGMKEPRHLLRTNQQAILDAHNWAPLSTEWDYDATRQRVMQETFPDEARRANRL